MITNSFILSFLNSLSLTPTANRVNFLRAWSASEGGSAQNNPFNTTWNMDSLGGSKYNSAGVRNYPNEDIGVKANSQTIKGGSFKPIYDILVSDKHVDEAGGPALINAFGLWGTGFNLISSTYKTRFKNKPVDLSSTSEVLKKKVT